MPATVNDNYRKSRSDVYKVFVQTWAFVLAVGFKLLHRSLQSGVMFM